MIVKSYHLFMLLALRLHPEPSSAFCCPYCHLEPSPAAVPCEVAARAAAHPMAGARTPLCPATGSHKVVLGKEWALKKKPNQ